MKITEVKDIDSDFYILIKVAIGGLGGKEFGGYIDLVPLMDGDKLSPDKFADMGYGLVDSARRSLQKEGKVQEYE